MNNALLNRLVDQRNGSAEERLGIRLIAGSNSRTQFLDLRTEPAPVSGIDFVSLLGLPGSLLCLLVIGHLLDLSSIQ